MKYLLPSLQLYFVLHVLDRIKNLLFILYVSACSKRIVVLRNPTDHKFDFCVCIRRPKGSQQVLVKSHSKMDAKKARRNAKSSLTRRCNNLVSMIENNRPLEEVTEALKLVEIDYKTAVTKHEELVEKIDDEEYAKEEKWIEEIREKTLILKFRAKDYILKLKEAQVTQNKNEENQEIAKSNQMKIA